MRKVSKGSLLPIFMILAAVFPSCERGAPYGADGSDPKAGTPSQVEQPLAESATTAQTSVELRIVQLFPESAEAGTGFNVQSNGESAMAVEAENATRLTQIEIDGQMLETTFGNPKLLSALVPRSFYDKPQVHVVRLRDDNRTSNEVTFTVLRASPR